MLEDLIVRYKLSDYHLIILSFFYGTVYLTWTSGLVFINPGFLGIAWKSLISVNLFWWGIVQAVLTFYLANKLVLRDWNHPRLSKIGWIICLSVNLFSILLFQVSGLIPKGTPIGMLTVLTILILSLCLFILSLRMKQTNIPVFKSSRLLNTLAVLTVCVFLFSAIFLTKDPILSNTSNVNALSLKIISLYTLALSAVIIGYRAVIRRGISV